MMIQELKRRAHRFVWPSIGVCLLVYFAYHLIQGERGLFSWVRLDAEVSQAQGELDVLKTKHGKLENRVKHLRDDQLSLELLEEESKKLGLAHPKETVAKRL